MRYGEALGAERLVETRNVAGTVSATTPFMRDFALEKGGMDAVFSEFNLDTPEVVEEKARLIYEDYISILSPKEVQYIPAHPLYTVAIID